MRAILAPTAEPAWGAPIQLLPSPNSAWPSISTSPVTTGSNGHLGASYYNKCNFPPHRRLWSDWVTATLLFVPSVTPRTANTRWNVIISASGLVRIQIMNESESKTREHGFLSLKAKAGRPLKLVICLTFPPTINRQGETMCSKSQNMAWVWKGRGEEVMVTSISSHVSGEESIRDHRNTYWC